MSLVCVGQNVENLKVDGKTFVDFNIERSHSFPPVCLVTSACKASSISGFVGLWLVTLLGVRAGGGSQQRKLPRKIASLTSA